MNDFMILYCRGDEYEGGCESAALLPALGNKRFDITAAVGWSFDSYDGFWLCPACSTKRAAR